MKVLVFGTFDGVHDGHRAALQQAKQHGQNLTVAVTPDLTAEKLKGHPPRQNSAQRIQALKNEHLVDNVVLSDENPNTWSILKKIKPDILALGYDQLELKESLENHLEALYPEVETEEGWQRNPKKPTIVILAPFKSDQLHNRFLQS